MLLNVDEVHAWPSSGLAGMQVITMISHMQGLHGNDLNHAGHSVILVCMIMCPASREKHHDRCPWAGRFLIYAERLNNIIRASGSLVEPSSGLHVLKQAMHASGVPLGEIFPLDQLQSYCNITPCFDHVVDSQLSCYNSIHFSHTMFLNKYFNKYFYFAVMGM